jgi:hypothetical protein
MPTTRLLSLDEYPLAADFLHRYWAPNHIYTRDKALFDWTFHREGMSHPGAYTFAVAEHAGEAVGVLGGIPFRFNDRGRERPGYWLANWKLRDEFRRGTTGLQLLDHFHASNDQVTISFGINPIVARLYDAMRWRVMENIPRYFAVHPGRAPDFAHLLQLANPAWPTGKGSTIANALLARRSRTASTVSFVAPAIDAWNKRSWASLRLKLTGPVRDGAYLHWRYVQHPTFKYRFIQVAGDDSSAIGLLVWRLETIRQKAGDTLQDVARVGRIVEFLPTSPDNAINLISHLWTNLDANGAIGCDCYLYHGPFGQWLTDAGLHRLDDHPDGNAVPSRFSPLDAAGGQIRSAVSLLTGPWPAYPFSADCTWYWTKSDSDQDRPN